MLDKRTGKIVKTKVSVSGERICLIKNNKEIGHAYLYFLSNNIHKKPFAFLEDVWVSTKYRSEGFGTKLLKKAITIAKQNNCYKIICTSRNERKKVHEWYTKNGFSEYGKEFRKNF